MGFELGAVFDDRNEPLMEKIFRSPVYEGGMDTVSNNDY